MRLCDICLFVTSLFHLAQCPLVYPCCSLLQNNLFKNYIILHCVDVAQSIHHLLVNRYLDCIHILDFMKISILGCVYKYF